MFYLKQQIDRLLTGKPDLVKVFNDANQTLRNYVGDPDSEANQMVPPHRARLMSGKVLRENLLAVIGRAPLYVGTSDPHRVTAFQEDVDKILQNVDPHKLYAVTAQNMKTIRKADAHDLTVALVNIYFDAKVHGSISSSKTNFVV